MNPTLDQTAFEDLTNILRKELEEYGALLALLVEQQEYILKRDPDTLFKINEKVDAQMQTNHSLLNRRKTIISNLAEQLGRNAESTVSQLIPDFPEPVQPMFYSLTEEINNLIGNARNKVKQNQILLSRLSEVTNELLEAVAPEGSLTKTYDRRGDVTISSNIEKRAFKTTV
jgi:hypothetical protein